MQPLEDRVHEGKVSARALTPARGAVAASVPDGAAGHNGRWDDRFFVVLGADSPRIGLSKKSGLLDHLFIVLDQFAVFVPQLCQEEDA